MNRFFIICSLLLFLAGGGSVIHAADSWSYPTEKPETPFGGGDGSQWNPYMISTAQHLANLAWMVNDGEEYEGKFFIMTNDITLNDNVIGSDGKSLKNAPDTYDNWTPIGRFGIFSDDEFMGTFDGRGHTIKGMVRLNDKDKICYNGLFGSLDRAVIKNLNMEDCYIQCTECAIEPRGDECACYGLISGYSQGCTYLNCTVSKSFIYVNTRYYAIVGGMCGFISGDYCSTYVTRMTNCKFNGKINTSNDKYGRIYVGGIIGKQSFDFYSSLYMDNCSASGDIDYQGNAKLGGIDAGGIASTVSREGRVSNCVSYMNITIKNPNNEIVSCYAAGFIGSMANYYDKKYISMSYNNCAYFGTITIGDTNNKVKTKNLCVSGIGNSGTEMTMVHGCVNYGKFDLHCTVSEKAQIASIANYLYVGDDYKQNVVYSVDNVLDVDGDGDVEIFDIDKVSNISIEDTKHKDYYCFETTDKRAIGCKYSKNSLQYAKTLAELKAEDFINTLNTNAGKSIWGKLSGTNSDLDGLPMPIGCGGDVTGLSGNGTVEKPFMISSEADLRALQNVIANGTQQTQNNYYKLTNDIYMSEKPMPSIGSMDYPFKGTFDGGGHAIVGMVAKNGYLFGELAGTLQNLALIDFKAVEGQSRITPLVNSVGGDYQENGQSGNTIHTGTVKNCYVAGDIKMVAKDDQFSLSASLAGLCGGIYEGSTMENCYFKGTFDATYPNPTSTITEDNKKITFGGCALYVHGTMKNCYASYSLNVDRNFTTQTLKGMGTQGSGATMENCNFVCPSSVTLSGGNKLSAESELNAKFSDIGGWSQGLYRPVLTSVKSYVATLPNNGGKKYLDAVPEPTPQSNYIINVTAGNDPYADKLIWQLPNVAVYVANGNTDYILNCTLDQSEVFKYTPTSSTTATKGQLRYDLKQTDKGYHMLCLPGVVERDDLPKDAKVMIVGKIQTVDDGKEQVNVVMVDTIPAGVPCMLYVPTSSVTKDETISLVMRSGIVSQPTVNATYSNFNGTFSNKELDAGACTTAKYSGDNNTLPCFVRNTEKTTAKPFTAWLEGATGDVQIVDFVLLDEENSAMTVALYGMNDKAYNLKMRRTIKASRWNTVCLPFDMTAKEITATFGENTKVETFSGLTYDATSTTLQFSEATAETEGGAVIKAGTPYLLKPGKTTDISIFEIKNRKIECKSVDYVPKGTKLNATTTAGTVYLTMKGEYNHRTITPDEATNGKSIYVISGNKIYYVDSEVEMKGFRCYFVAEETVSGSGAKLFSGARLMHSDGSSTDLRLIKADATGEGGAVYDLLGRKRDEQTKGVVIENGKKRIVK